MPRAYSSDLRERALAAYEAGDGSQAAVARGFRVGERTLSGRLKAVREDGRRAPRPRRGGRAPVGGEREALAGLVAERNDATLAEYADLPAERAGVRRSPSALCRALKALGLVRKKRRPRPPSGTARTRPRRGPRGAPSRPGSTPPASCPSTRPGSTPARPEPTPSPPGATRHRPGPVGTVGAAGRDRRARARRRGREP